MPSPADTFTAYADALYLAIQARERLAQWRNTGVEGAVTAAAEWVALADSRAFSLHRQLKRETLDDLSQQEVFFTRQGWRRENG